MKLSVIVLAAVILLTSWANNGYSGQRELHGLLIGAGSGAIIGHALGGDAESTIIGSALGGIVGIAAGSVYAGNYHRPEPQYHRQKHHNGYGDRYQRHYRSYWPSKKYYPDCRILKKRIHKHGQSYFITKRICNNHEGKHSNRNYKPGRYKKFYNQY